MCRFRLDGSTASPTGYTRNGMLHSHYIGVFTSRLIGFIGRSAGWSYASG